jgi:hypothetical protein
MDSIRDRHAFFAEVYRWPSSDQPPISTIEVISRHLAA